MARSKKRKRAKEANLPKLPVPAWMEHDGMHVIIPDEGLPPDLETMCRIYQDKIRHSPLWDTMVAEFGAERAERALR